MSNLQAVRYHDGERWCVGLMAIGHKRMKVVVIGDNGLRLAVEPKDAARYTQPLERHGKPYPVERLVRNFRRYARDVGITNGARAVLEEAT